MSKTLKSKNIIKMCMEFREIFCNNCKKLLGRYNVNFYSEANVADIINSVHVLHSRAGHEIKIKKIKYE